MSRYDHENLGEAAQTFFLSGRIVKLNKNEDGTPTGLCTVKIKGATYCNVPLFYHCRGQSELLVNGSLKGAHQAFKPGDNVIVQVLGHIDSKIPCSDEDICEPELPGITKDGLGNPVIPNGGFPEIFEGVDSPLEADCGTVTTIPLRCGENGSQGGLSPAPGDPQAVADECVFDLSNAQVGEVLGVGANNTGTFSNLSLAPNPDGSGNECVTFDYEPGDECECPEDCTPGEILCTETLPNGIQINTICPEPEEGSGACTSDGSALAIVGPTNNEMLISETFNFTSNAAPGSVFRWSTPDGGGEGDNISYTAPDSNSDCVANFTISLTCISSDGVGNLSTETVSLFISVKESSSTNAAYRTGAVFTSIQLNLANYDKDEFDCTGTFRSTIGAQVTAGNCTGHVDCCTVTNPGGGRCGSAAKGDACADCCATDPDELVWENCGIFAPPTIYDVVDMRSAALIDQGCCPDGLSSSGTEPPY